MTSGPSMTELRRGVLGPCVLALLERRPRFGLELVRDLSAADGLLTSDGTVYPLLNRLRDQLKSALGTAAFQAAWEHGAQVTQTDLKQELRLFIANTLR